jgi:hypothetical protein
MCEERLLTKKEDIETINKDMLSRALNCMGEDERCDPQDHVATSIALIKHSAPLRGDFGGGGAETAACLGVWCAATAGSSWCAARALPCTASSCPQVRAVRTYIVFACLLLKDIHTTCKPLAVRIRPSCGAFHHAASAQSEMLCLIACVAWQ